jgi:hypothetical protein
MPCFRLTTLSWWAVVNPLYDLSVCFMLAVSLMLPAAKGIFQSVIPGSGPAARLKGTPLPVSSATTEDFAARRHIPGWTGPDKIAKSNMSTLEQQREHQRAVVAQQRARAAALKAEVEASKGRGSKAQPSSHAAGATLVSAKDPGGEYSPRSSCAVTVANEGCGSARGMDRSKCIRTTVVIC